MSWLNYHHLFYFRETAKAGSLKAAAEKLRLSPPTISAQLATLEDCLGVKLFLRSGRGKKLTEAGLLVLDYAEEIFSLGEELSASLAGAASSRMMRLHAGIVDSVPKLVAKKILEPMFRLSQAVHLSCREGKLDSLLGSLSDHKLDVLLADEPASGVRGARLYNHSLGASQIVVCAEHKMARHLRRNFPRSLDGAPGLLPGANTAMRRNLDRWFNRIDVYPLVQGEFDDPALMKTFAAEGRGFVAIPSVEIEEARKRYGFSLIGPAEECMERFYVITAERRIEHPIVKAITKAARSELFD